MTSCPPTTNAQNNAAVGVPLDHALDAPPLDEAAAAAQRAELLALAQREGLRLGASPGLLAATYAVGKQIGQGKFACVFKAERLSDGMPVALKQVAIFDATDNAGRARCLKEIRLVQGLRHPNIVQFLDAFLEERTLVLAFEFAEAGDLKRQLRKAREREARFEERVVWKYFAQVADAVAHMHGVRTLHRDLKPANVFLTLAGVVKVGDLGLGRLLSDHTLQAHSKVGTPLYMAPEVLRGGGHGYAADVWSLGCILYELAMTVSPFKAPGLNLYGLFHKITAGDYPPVADVYSHQLRELVAACLRADPALRPPAADVARVAGEMRAPATAAPTIPTGVPAAVASVAGRVASAAAPSAFAVPPGAAVAAAALRGSFVAAALGAATGGAATFPGSLLAAPALSAAEDSSSVRATPSKGGIAGAAPAVTALSSSSGQPLALRGTARGGSFVAASAGLVVSGYSVGLQRAAGTGGGGVADAGTSSGVAWAKAPSGGGAGLHAARALRAGGAAAAVRPRDAK